MPQIVQVFVVLGVYFALDDVVEVAYQQSTDLLDLGLVLLQPGLQIVVLVLQEVVFVLQL